MPLCRGVTRTEAGRHLRLVARKELALHVLFVCTGNICRSPTAERLAAAYLQAGTPGLVISSAGTRAVIGHPVHPAAAAVLEKLGGDPSDFAARQLTARSTSNADLILTMTKAHRDAVLELAPRRLNRTFTLTEASRLASECNARTLEDLAVLRPHLPPGSLSDIPDPIGQDEHVFATVGAQIAELLPPILELCRPSDSV